MRLPPLTRLLALLTFHNGHFAMSHTPQVLPPRRGQQQTGADLILQLRLLGTELLDLTDDAVGDRVAGNSHGR